jgi:hypothetical protein
MNPFESMSPEERNEHIQEIMDRTRYGLFAFPEDMYAPTIPFYVIDAVRRQFEAITKRNSWRNPIFIRSRDL